MGLQLLFVMMVGYACAGPEGAFYYAIAYLILCATFFRKSYEC